MSFAKTTVLNICVQHCGGFEPCTQNDDFAKDIRSCLYMYANPVKTQNEVSFDRGKSRCRFEVKAKKIWNADIPCENNSFKHLCWALRGIRAMNLFDDFAKDIRSCLYMYADPIKTQNEVSFDRCRTKWRFEVKARRTEFADVQCENSSLNICAEHCGGLGGCWPKQQASRAILSKNRFRRRNPRLAPSAAYSGRFVDARLRAKGVPPSRPPWGEGG